MLLKYQKQYTTGVKIMNQEIKKTKKLSHNKYLISRLMKMKTLKKKNKNQTLTILDKILMKMMRMKKK